MSTKFYLRVEMAFWDLFIYTLSESKWIRRIIRGIYNFIPQAGLLNAIKTTSVVALLGFFSGIIVFLLAFTLN